MPNAMDPKYEYEVASAIYPDPANLFERDPDYKPYPWQNHRYTIGTSLAVGTMRIGGMWVKCRPMYSGIHRTVLYFVIGGILGEIIQRGVESYTDFRSQVHRHYIQLHPDRFPPPKKEKIGDKWELWRPVRQ